jgi:hypothetical protein
MNKNPIALALVAPLLAAGLFAGCAAPVKPPEDIVLERAQERLDLILVEDYVAAYEYLTPGYRSSVTLPAYQRDMALRRARWTAAKATRSDCGEDVCKVRISMDFTVYGAVPGVSSFATKGSGEENWIRTDGQWYHVPEN